MPILFTIIILALSTLKSSTAQIVSEFESAANIQHLVYDPSSATLYLGATNNLYQLDANTLSQKHHFLTGPKLDNPYCNWDGKDCIAPRIELPTEFERFELLSDDPNAGLENAAIINPLALRPTNCVNKILLLHKKAGVLVVCGSTQQGVCNLHSAHNISHILPYPQGSEGPVPVASNAINASTVALIAPGPVEGGQESDTLFVGATYTTQHYRDGVGAVSSRSLEPNENLFQLVDPGDIIGQSSLTVKAEYRKDFLIHYVKGFHSNDQFIYWATVQKEAPLMTGAPFVSKLVRVCGRDKRYESYGELILECRGPDNTNYNLIKALYHGNIGSDVLEKFAQDEELNGEKSKESEFLIGIFGKGTEPTKPERGHSAICFYSMKKIRTTFWYNMQRCLNGVGTWNLPHFGYNRQCQKISSASLAFQMADSCPIQRLGGYLRATALAIQTYSKTQLTSIAVDIIHGEKTVLFLGTDKGTVKKFLLKSEKVAEEFEEIRMGRSAIGEDLVMSIDGRHFYGFDRKTLFKVKLANCEQFSSCKQCRQSKNPYCGWCTLENRCSQKSTCAHSHLQNGYLTHKNTQCPSGSIIEKLISLAKDVDLEFTMNGMPLETRLNQYKCVFAKNVMTNVRSKSNNRYKCRVAADKLKMMLIEGKDHIESTIEILSTASNQTVLKFNVIYYHCSAIQMCSLCSQSFNCRWCLATNNCMEEGLGCSEELPKQNYNQCTQISDKNSEILVPNGVPTELSIKTINLTPSDDLECSVGIKGEEEVITKAELLPNGIVKCAKETFTFKTDKPIIEAELKLGLKNGQIIDKTSVKFYKCDLLGSDCSKCGSLDEKYHCSWCENQCQNRGNCPINFRQISNCPEPTIDKISPTKGTIYGGTKITIFGHNLGSKKADIENGVSVAGVPCGVLNYEASSKIICTTKPEIPKIAAGPVIVKINNSEAISSQKFHFVRPEIHILKPSYGPKSGGTKLRISGKNLDAPQNIDVWLDGNKICNLIPESISESEFECFTPTVKNVGPSRQPVRIRMDGKIIEIEQKFTYVPDSTVIDIKPRVAFRSGGRLLTVFGRNLNATQTPLLYYISADQGIVSEKSPCWPISDQELRCPSPKLRENAGRSRRALEMYPAWGVGFEMDGIEVVRDLSDRIQIIVVPDPIYYQFPERVRIYQKLNTETQEGNEPLVLEGKHLNLASTPSEINVKIGTNRCEIKLLTSNQLICVPKIDKNSAQSTEFLVSVEIGASEPQILGKLAYGAPSSHFLGGLFSQNGIMRNRLAIGVIIGAGCLILLATMLSIVIWWRRKSWLADNEYRRIQLQMDNLESSVRQECKSAFAELQTEVNGSFTGDLMALGEVPIHSQSVYASKFLFSDYRQQMFFTLDRWNTNYYRFNGISNGIENLSPGLRSAIQRFESFLWNRYFILNLVQTLESQPSFTIQDRVYVASLITALLSRNMQYCTEITFLLLEKQLLKKEPVYRRSDSIVDKMLANWVALSSYSYVSSSSNIGSTLFFLVSALDQQASKGPVDQISGEARYSLCAEALLKEQIDYELMTIQVVPQFNNNNNSSEPNESKIFTLSVLSCDTPDQVKVKIIEAIYHHVPYSQRPSLGYFQIEWRSPKGNILLQNVEKSTSKDTGLKQLNTLSHYGVTNNSTFVLSCCDPAKTPSNTSTSSNSSGANPPTYYSSTVGSLIRLIPSRTGGGRGTPDDSHSHGSSSGNSGNNEETTVVVSPKQYWHLVSVRPATNLNSSLSGTLSGRKSGPLKSPTGNLEKSSSVIPEVYLTRLLANKASMQRCIDDVFRGIFKVNGNFPVAVKYLFDFFDQQMGMRQIPDHTISYSWKNNLLFRRFWYRLIKNPRLLLDISGGSETSSSTTSRESSLSMISQLLLDIFDPPSGSNQLTKDSPPDKLLFAKDLPVYRKMLDQFHADLKAMPSVSEQELNAEMSKTSKDYQDSFNIPYLLRELMAYVIRHSDHLLDTLDRDSQCQKQNLADKLEQTLMLLDPKIEHCPNFRGGEEENIYAVVT